MKLTHVNIAATLLLSIAMVLSQQTSVAASQQLKTLEQVNRLSRDLVPFPDFFQEGRKKFEREIQLIDRIQNASSTEPLLKIHVNSQTEIDRLLQLKPNDLQQSNPHWAPRKCHTTQFLVMGNGLNFLRSLCSTSY